MIKQFSFGASPTVKMRRSRFDLSHDVKTSCNLGTLCPIDVQEVLPGDTFKMKTTQVVRLSTSFIRPIMDNIYMDTYYFFVPNRIVFDGWEETMGENKKSAWSNLDPPDVPTTKNSSFNFWNTVADYMGLPVNSTKTLPSGINILPFRGFAMIYDQWFRNENVIDPMLIQKGNQAGSNESLNNLDWSPNNYMGKPPKVGKRKDYFTACLPAPQKGDSVQLPLGESAPVTMNIDSGSTSGSLSYTSPNNNLTVIPSVSPGTPGVLNLFADLSGATATDVNDLRMAFQLQKMLEKDARYGTRYREYLLGHFGVSNPDARMQIPEFLGGSRMPVNVQQVAQTNTQEKDSSGSVQSPLASLGAMSQSVGRSRFTKSFTEHGFVFTCICFRQLHTYQQGINKMWQRKKRTDYYDPLFANLGEQPVWRSEIFAPGETELQGDVFGYNEAWADYRYKPSQITGQMRNDVYHSLSVWHLGDYYVNAPVLSKEFIEESPVNIDRSVSVPSNQQDNFICDFHFETQAFRVMPVYSVPGLVDHH